MAYEKQNFEDGQILSAEHLNKIEAGIEEAFAGIEKTQGDVEEAMAAIAAITGAQIQSGSYVGTGTKGSSGANSITFNFAPKVVMFTYINTTTFANYHGHAPALIDMGTLTTSYASCSLFGSSSMAKKSSNGTKVYWYTTASDAQYQYNVKDGTYRWIAIG